MPKPVAAFPKSARLLCNADFRHVFNKATKSADSCFVIFGRPNGCDTARLGLAISRRCALRAVDRNRIKRLIREYFRTSRRNLSGIDYVVICRPHAVGLSNLLLANSLSKHFNRVRFLLCGSS